MEQTTHQSGFLGLPRELRDEIYQHLIYANVDPPPYPTLPRQPPSQQHNGEEVIAPRCPHWRYPSLVWTCRQLRREYFSLVSLLLASGQLLKAEMDIMCRGYLLWPTWTYLPPYLPPNTPFDLNVHLRIFSTEGFRSNDGWPRQPGTLFRDLLLMLKRLIQYGPSFLANKECPPGGLPRNWLASEWSHPEDQPSDYPMLMVNYPGRNHVSERRMRSRHLFKINKLTVKTTYHEYYTPDTWPGTTHSIFKWLKELATSGLAHGVLKTVRAHSTYGYKGETKIFDAAWDVPEHPDSHRREIWNETGFLERGTHCLSEAYVPDVFCNTLL